jgi:diguanylate cyclase (GGDEF)-like protein
MLDKIISTHPIFKDHPEYLTLLVLDSVAEHVAIVDTYGEIIATNKAWNKFARDNSVGSPERLGVGANYLEVCEDSLKTDQSVEDFYMSLKFVLNGKLDKFTTEYPCHSKTEKRWFLVSVTPFKIKNETIGAIVSHFNITPRKLAELELKRLATTDALTGIMNRQTGLDYIQQKIQLCSRYGNIFSVCFIDIDNLKNVNDIYGHREGDRLISTVVGIIQKALRVTDSMSRLGGDEFLIIFPNTPVNSIDTIIERIKEGIDRQNTKGTLPCKIEISYGAAECDPKDELTADEIVSLADHKMYQMKMSKKQGKRQPQTENLN